MISSSSIPRDFSELDKDATADYSSIQSDTVLISGLAGHHIEIHGIAINTSTTTGVVVLKEETSGDIKHKTYLSAQNKDTANNVHKDLAVGKDLLIDCPANTFVSVTYHYKKE